MNGPERAVRDEIDQAVERLPPHSAERTLWRVMVDTNTNWCRHCGDMTSPDDDPSPTLCAMCVKAGRA